METIDYQQGIDIGAICTAYGYVPSLPKTDVERVDLKIQWPEIPMDPTSTHFPLSCDLFYMDGELLHLCFDFDDPKSTLDSPYFAISLNSKSDWSEVGHFVVQTEGNTTNIKHRFVPICFRRQAIGDQLLRLVEHCIQVRANLLNHNQEIVVKIAQLGVLDWFLKHGYTPRSDCDEANLTKIMAGSPDFFIADCTTDSGQPRPKSVFNTYADHPHFLGNITFDNYLGSTCLIALKKDKSPAISAAEPISSPLSSQVHQVLQLAPSK